MLLGTRSARPTESLTSLYIHPGGAGSLLYEKETRSSDGRIQHKHYVTGGAGLVGVYVIQPAYGGNPAEEGMRYFHTDQVGSVAAVTNSAGVRTATLGYEAFGERREAGGAQQNRESPLTEEVTDRGYTGHEHLDELNLIHMNGRIFDPALGRFMTPDPFVQAPGYLQSYNRYAYGMNSPLGGMDPSG